MFDKKVQVDLSWDADSDAGYLRFSAESRDVVVARTITIRDKNSQVYGAIDLADDGKLLGIELLGVSEMLGQHILGS